MFEIRKLIDYDYLIEWAIEDGANREDAENARDSILFGYEAWEDGKILGTAYATYRDGLYTLDGHNKTNKFFGACILGKAVINDLFRDYTDTIFTYHDTERRSVTALAKRLGFKEVVRDKEKDMILLMLGVNDGS